MGINGMFFEHTRQPNNIETEAVDRQDEVADEDDQPLEPQNAQNDQTEATAETQNLPDASECSVGSRRRRNRRGTEENWKPGNPASRSGDRDAWDLTSEPSGGLMDSPKRGPISIERRPLRIDQIDFDANPSHDLKFKG